MLAKIIGLVIQKNVDNAGRFEDGHKVIGLTPQYGRQFASLAEKGSVVRHGMRWRINNPYKSEREGMTRMLSKRTKNQDFKCLEQP